MWPDATPDRWGSTSEAPWRGLDLDRVAAALPAPVDVAPPASNAWVVAGRLTETGRPLLAHDPHLGFDAPVLWYLARIEAPGLHVTGATVPGVPFTILGQNDRIAWGMTAT